MIYLASNYYNLSIIIANIIGLFLQIREYKISILKATIIENYTSLMNKKME
jgi:hypothetical protein